MRSFLVIGIVSLLLLLGGVKLVVRGAHIFGSGSGFEKAKHEPRTSINVWKDPTLYANVPNIILPWNNLTGWSLFKIVTDQTLADVKFVKSSSTWVKAEPNYTDPYTSCIIYSATTDTYTLRHEIGHCLGFADHVWKVYYGDPRWINPKVCDDPSHPAYSPYKGVMSYCDWSYPVRWFGADDSKMIIDAGYKSRTRAIPSPTSSPSPTVSPTPSPLCRILCK